MLASITPAHRRLQHELQSRLEPGVAVVCTGVDGDPESLWPEERAAVAQAIPRRQREFAAGRTAAREAMGQIGWPPSALPAGLDRSPIWPSGLVGSIAHTGRTCVAIAGRRDQVHAMGIDIEEDSPLERDIWETICTQEEIYALSTVPPSERGRSVTRMFCAKEAFYKWQYAQTRSLLEFSDVQITLNPGSTTFSVHAAETTEPPVLMSRNDGHLLTCDGLVLAWLTGAAK